MATTHIPWSIAAATTTFSFSSSTSRNAPGDPFEFLKFLAPVIHMTLGYDTDSLNLSNASCHFRVTFISHPRYFEPHTHTLRFFLLFRHPKIARNRETPMARHAKVSGSSDLVAATSTSIFSLQRPVQALRYRRSRICVIRLCAYTSKPMHQRGQSGLLT